MKNKIILLGALALFIFSCNTDERQINPGERPDERIAEAIKQYKSALMEAEHGWKAVLYPGGGAGYSFHFKFSENDRVTMLSDINEETAAEELESTYRIRAMQRPTLIFDTYSYVHILSDPDERKSGGDRGQGKYSDFEFIIESVEDDVFTFTGKYHDSKLELKKASQQDAENFVKNVSAVAKEFDSINTFTTYFKRLKTGEKSFDLEVDTNLRTLNFSYSQSGQIKTFNTSYYFTEEGLQLLEAFTNDEVTISSFKNIQYNSNIETILLSINEKASEIASAIAPSQIDKAAASNLKQSLDYYLSPGFTVEGVEDAHDLYQMEGFSFLVFWPKYGTEAGYQYDLLGFVFGNSIHFGIATLSSVTNDGRFVNEYFGILGETTPEEEETINKVMEKWADPDGFYVVQKSDGVLDLVSAKDGKAWISLY